MFGPPQARAPLQLGSVGDPHPGLGGNSSAGGRSPIPGADRDPL